MFIFLDMDIESFVSLVSSGNGSIKIDFIFGCVVMCE